MAKQPPFLEQFRSFYFQNNPKDIEEAIEYFSVFGGMGWNVDTSIPLIELIETKVLKNYTYIHADITTMTYSDRVNHSLLTAVAIGDRRIFSSFKKAKISRDEGDKAIDALCDAELIEIEPSLELPPKEEDHISDKLNFKAPFMRFWFSFISPFFKNIKAGDYKEVKERFTNREQGFSDLVFQKLSQELLKKSFKDDPIVKIGGYWDKNAEIDVLARTKSGKLIAGVCKYSNAKVKKSELSKLKERCALAELEPDICAIFSKNGFSNELKTLKGEDLKLYTIKNFKTLVEDLGEKDLIRYVGKKY